MIVFNSYGLFSKIFDFAESRMSDGRQMLFVVMEFGSIDLARVLKETANSERGLTGVKTKFYWEEMLEAVQVAHQVKTVPRLVSLLLLVTRTISKTGLD